MLIALRILLDIVSECLGSMTGERLDGVRISFTGYG
jgi:hypothetical protein